MQEAAARQFSFRLPTALVERVDTCTDRMQTAGLEVTRADVVRMLLKHALDDTRCRLELLLGSKTKKKSTKRRT
ncbi:MAG TPA: hypothetical protein VER33_25860 [Polyangiaceae bacterium]|nr:hypothetical protein [Polyangiaceae bacterium]